MLDEVALLVDLSSYPGEWHSFYEKGWKICVDQKFPEQVLDYSNIWDQEDLYFELVFGAFCEPTMLVFSALRRDLILHFTLKKTWVRAACCSGK